MEPRFTSRGFASSASTTENGRAIVIMLSCTTPTFSKMPASVHMNQPDMFMSRMMRPVTTLMAPIEISPRLHSHRASPVVPTSTVPFSVHSTASMMVLRRSWSW